MHLPALPFGPVHRRGSDDAVSTILRRTGYYGSSSKASGDGAAVSVEAQRRPMWSSVRGGVRMVRRRLIDLAVGAGGNNDNNNINNNINNNREDSRRAFLNAFRGGGGIATATTTDDMTRSNDDLLGPTSTGASKLAATAAAARPLWRRKKKQPSSSPQVFGLSGGGPGDATVDAWTSVSPSSSLSSPDTATVSTSVMVSSPPINPTVSISRAPNSHHHSRNTDAWVIETPLFPIILPKEWEPRTSVAVSVAPPPSAPTTAATRSTGTTVTSSPELLAAASRPLIPTSVWHRFDGTEFRDASVVAALATTGLRLADPRTTHDCGVVWSAESRRTSKFVDERVYGSEEWYGDLDESGEVLVWTGKFDKGDDGPGRGGDLPLVKTTTVVRRSPEFLADLLMDSSKVRVYNKMSVGRTDEVVFQKGIDTVDGEFGDGESKVVRNLTKPPLVSSLIEFVTCMHARKLREDDNLSTSEKVDGYIVVSRAVTGGEWSEDNENGNGSSSNNVRSEILLGVNVLRAVPGQPDKTEITAVTHVYSPLVPQMLAKNAGVKGAVDFVRDIRALP